MVGLISPWNLPLYLLSWKIAPAIAAGNTCVAKPSELTPMTANRLAELSLEAGIPPGVINIVHGYGDESRPRADLRTTTSPRSRSPAEPSPAPRSPRTPRRGSRSSRWSSAARIRTSIFADADLDDAIATSIRSSFWNQGEICLCGSRIFVERSIYDEFVERFVAATKKLRIGDPLDDTTDVGALISEAHLEKVMGYIELAKQEGGTIVAGGHRVDRPGYFVEPTVITGLGMRLPRPAGRDLRPGRHDHAVRQRRRSDRVRQLHALRPLRHGLDARPRSARTASPPRSTAARSGSTAGSCATSASRSAA